MKYFPPKTILVAFDRTLISAQAWRHALPLAARVGASLEVVYVEPVQPAGVGFYPLPDLTPDRTREIRARIRAVVGEHVKIHIVEGDPAGRILGMARARHAGLIVMGTHGRRGALRFLLGSVAEEVMRSSTVPVLAARGPVKPVQAILSPVNFTSYSNRGFAYAGSVAESLGASLTALHVTNDPIWSGNPRMRLSRMIDSLAPSLRKRSEYRLVTSSNATDGILRAAAKHDWIVLVAHKKSPIEDTLLGTTAERILRRSKKPILVVPPPRPSFKGLPAAASSRHGRT